MLAGDLRVRAGLPGLTGVSCGEVLAGAGRSSRPGAAAGQPHAPGRLGAAARAAPTGRSAAARRSRVTSYAGVEDDQDRQRRPRASARPRSAGRQTLATCAPRSPRSRRHRWPSRMSVQHRGPGGAARLQRRDHRVRPARDHLRLAPPAAVHVRQKQPRPAGWRRAGAAASLLHGIWRPGHPASALSSGPRAPARSPGRPATRRTPPAAMSSTRPWITASYKAP